MDRIVGVCGNCGGNVTVPDAWLGINPPVPTCHSCGSTARNTAPVLPMNPRPEIDQLRKSWEIANGRTA